MTTSYTVRDARRLRAAAQRLGVARGSGIHDVVSATTVQQAQDAKAARLALRARTKGLTAADVDRAVADRELVRTWAMRGTLHLLVAEDLRWIQALFEPELMRMTALRRKRLGLTDRLVDRAAAASSSVLAGGPLTRPAYVEALARRRVKLGDDPQAAAHLVLTLAARGVICRGPESPGDHATYVLREDWVPAARARERSEAQAELARRHVRAYGPATPRDFAAWTGMRMPDANAGYAAIAGELTEVEVDGERQWVLGSAPAVPGAQAPAAILLGAFDTLQLGHRPPSRPIDPAHASKVVSGGLIRQAILVDGRIAGTWRRGEPPTWFAPPTAAQERAVERELADVERFLS